MTRRYRTTLTIEWESTDTSTAQREQNEAIRLLSDDAFDVTKIGALDEVDDDE